MSRVSALLPDLGIVTPALAARQPGRDHIRVRLCGGKGAMIERGVIGDFRAPDIMRFGFAPLCLRFADGREVDEIPAVT
jgi:kynureninase